MAFGAGDFDFGSQTAPVDRQGNGGSQRMGRNRRLERRSAAARWPAVALGCLMLAGCAGSTNLSRQLDPKYGVAASPRVVEPGQPVPKGGGTYRVGKPYLVAGRMYVPEEGRGYRTEGLASWYGEDFHGRLTANGEVYDMHAISAAHPTLPMPSYVRVTNVANRRSLIVRVNDRGPYHGNRVIDLSGKAADLLGFRGRGVARVRVEYVGPASLEGSDDRVLTATLREGLAAPAPSLVRVAAANPFVETGGLRGPAPLPRERPFELGEGAPAREANMRERPLEMTAAARARSGGWTVSAARPEAVPVSLDVSRAVASGRGLY